MKNGVLILFLLVSVQLLGQDVYKKGYFITAEGDTSQCLISNLSSSKELRVRTIGEATTRTIKSNAVNGYSYEGNSFVTKIATLTNYKSVRYGSRTLTIIDSNLVNQTDTVFLKKIVSGKINLYGVHYLNDEHYLLAEKNGVIYELQHEFSVVKLDDLTTKEMENKPLQLLSGLGIIVYDKKPYLNTLQLLLNDGFTASPIESFRYSEDKIIALINTYNKKDGGQSRITAQKEDKKRFYFGVSVGSLYVIADEYYGSNGVGGLPFTFSANLLYALGYNNTSFLKVAYNNYSYFGGERAVRNISIGARKVLGQGKIRPYVEVNLAAGYQFLGKFKSALNLSNSIETGVFVPVKSKILTFNVNFTPLLFSQHGYQFVSYSLGILF